MSAELSRARRAIAQGLEKCKHFNGMLNKTCAAGVTYMDVRDASQPPARWPCQRLLGYPAATTVCAKRELMTAEELADEEIESNRIVNEALAGRCQTCGMTMTKQEGRGTTVWSCPTHGFVMRGCGVEEHE